MPSNTKFIIRRITKITKGGFGMEFPTYSEQEEVTEKELKALEDSGIKFEIMDGEN